MGQKQRCRGSIPKVAEPSGQCLILGHGDLARLASPLPWHSQDQWSSSPEMTSSSSISFRPSRKSSSMFSICVPAFRRWELHHAVNVCRKERKASGQALPQATRSLRRSRAPHCVPGTRLPHVIFQLFCARCCVGWYCHPCWLRHLTGSKRARNPLSRASKTSQHHSPSPQSIFTQSPSPHCRAIAEGSPCTASSPSGHSGMDKAAPSF